MIPQTLAAFRALMGRAAEGDSLMRDFEMLRALAAATPEQLLGIVGEVVEHNTRTVLVSGGHYGPYGTVVVDGPSVVFRREVVDYLVTPREDA